MKTNYYHYTRILVHYIFMKLNDKVEGLKQEDLCRFFEEKGWNMYNINRMIRDIQSWKHQET